MQISNHNNNPNFGAKIAFRDKGNCLSLRQKFQLRSIAKGIGNNSDRLYIGTRKYDNISVYDSNMHFQRKDMQILSNINNKNREHMFSHKNIQNKVEKDTSNYFYDLPQKERWNRFNNKMFEQLKDFLNNITIIRNSRKHNMSALEARCRFIYEIEKYIEDITELETDFKQYKNSKKDYTRFTDQK